MLSRSTDACHIYTSLHEQRQEAFQLKINSQGHNSAVAASCPRSDCHARHIARCIWKVEEMLLLRQTRIWYKDKDDLAERWLNRMHANSLEQLQLRICVTVCDISFLTH